MRKLSRILRLTVDAESQDFRAKAIVKAQAVPNRVLSSISQSLAAEKIAAPRRRQMQYPGLYLVVSVFVMNGLTAHANLDSAGLIGHRTFDGENANHVTGLVAYYPFNGNAKDESGNGYDGVVRGTTTLAADRFGNTGRAYYFDGNTNGGIEAPNTSNLNFTSGGFSLLAWVCITNYNDDGTIAGKHNYGYYNGYFINVTHGRFAFYLNENPRLVAEETCADGQWRHVAGVWDGTTAYLYVDGVLKKSGPGNYANFNNANFTIGRATGIHPPGWLNGKIDEVRLYNGALSSNEVRRLYEQGSTPGGDSALYFSKRTASSGDYDLHTIRPDLLHPNLQSVSMNDSSGDQKYPVVSPDGRFVLYTIGAAASPNFQLWALDRSTGQKQYLFAGHPEDWHPSGQRFAYISNEFCDEAIHEAFVNVTPTGLVIASTRVLFDSNRPAGALGVQYSPDGARIAFDYGIDGCWYDYHEICVGSITGSLPISESALIRLTTDRWSDSQPHWTPDGRQIIWGRAPSDQNYMNLELWRKNADGSGSEQLVEIWTNAGNGYLSFCTPPAGYTGPYQAAFYHQTLKNLILLRNDGGQDLLTIGTNDAVDGLDWINTIDPNPEIPAITTTLLPLGVLNDIYTGMLAATNGSLPYAWSLAGGSLPPGLTLEAASGVITGTPTASGLFSFTVQVEDAGSPAQTATKDLNLSVALSLWPNTATPIMADGGPDDPVELGVKFQSEVTGTIAGIRFYKAEANTGVHVGNLWTSNGAWLATVAFTNETASGWQQALFVPPVAITNRAIYVVSYHADNGHYSEDTNYFAGRGVDRPPLRAPADGESGGNGVYAYGPSGVFPSQTWHSANYWVDVLFVGESPANEHFVDLSNSAPSWPYADWTTAATTIQDAVDAANSGDTVWVAEGVYAMGGRTAGGQAMTNRVAIDKPLTVQSVNGPRVTMIQGQGPLGADAVRCAYVTNGAKLVGFTVTNGFTDKRLGEFVVKAGEGGGVYCESTAGTVSNCILTGNSATYGGGACNGALYNCLLIGNSAYYGGGSFDCTLYNCTLAGNSANWYGGGSFEGALYNCILYENTSLEEGPNYSGGCVFNYSCTTPDPGGMGNIANEPMFVDPGSGNFHLKIGSPCIDVGDNAYASETTDLDGRPRIVNGIVDMGAYEYDGWKYDSDRDGMKDAWESRYGLNPTNSEDASLDGDNDGAVNLNEYIADTDPTNKASYFHIGGISNLPPITIYFESSTSRVYSLVERDELMATHPWLMVGGQSNLWGTGAILLMNDFEGGITARFYRIKVDVPSDDGTSPRSIGR